MNFCPQCSLLKAFISPFLHTYPQHIPAQPCCVSLAPSPPATSEILLVSQSCPSSSIWLSIPTKLHALTLHSSLLKVKVCPSIPHPYAFANISFGSTSPSMENRWWQSYSKADSIDLKFIPNSQCTFLSQIRSRRIQQITPSKRSLLAILQNTPKATSRETLFSNESLKVPELFKQISQRMKE